MNIQGYLKRIGLREHVGVTKEVLFNLQEAHVRNVPFENLDIHYNKKITLDVDSFYNKIVKNRRGGFCYELNGLFYQLLKELGFDVKMVSGRVYSKNGEYGKEYDHLAIIATVNKHQYLVDVGFGKFALKPLEITLDNKQLDDKFGLFEFDTYEGDYLRINEVVNKQLIPQYIFKTKARSLSEFNEMCIYHQSNKNSHFTQSKLISIATYNGRITLTNNLVKISERGNEKEYLFESDQFEVKLKKYFDISL